MEKTLQTLTESGILIERSYLLSGHSGFHIGGLAAAAAFPTDVEQIILLLKEMRSSRIPFLVMGNATNVVFPDKGYEGIVIFTSRMRGERIAGDTLHLEAGVSMRRAAVLARERALTGLEFAYGIPGTVGGGIFMNAGAYGQELADVCVKSEYYNTATGSIGTLTGVDQRFFYRSSIYQEHPEWVILKAELSLSKGEPSAIAAQMEEQQARRRASQPLEYPNAGSVFKRPAGDYAGRLIEVCGLKGTRIGGAEVSTKHAGFIVNRGGATARDVKDLVELIQERVLTSSGVTLECEIRFIE